MPLPSVLAEMARVAREITGNPSSIHESGRRARSVLEDARDRVAHTLGAAPAEIVFTASATEANNLAVLGLVLGHEPDHAICLSPLEHSSVRGPAETLRLLGHPVRDLPVLRDGRVDLDGARRVLDRGPAAVALVAVQNETGVIQPVDEMATLCKERTLLLHCDAVQALGKIPLSLQKLGADTASLSGHKVHGPRGIGILWVRRGVELTPVLRGGDHEDGRRPGTENVAAAAGLARALEELAPAAQQSARLLPLKTMIAEGLRRLAEDVVITVPPQGQVANTLHVSFPGISGQDMVAAADMAGIALATGSACHQATGKPSPALQAMGLTEDEVRGAVRLSLGSTSSAEQCRELLLRLEGILARFRRARNPVG